MSPVDGVTWRSAHPREAEQLRSLGIDPERLDARREQDRCLALAILRTDSENPVALLALADLFGSNVTLRESADEALRALEDRTRGASAAMDRYLRERRVQEGLPRALQATAVAEAAFDDVYEQGRLYSRHAFREEQFQVVQAETVNRSLRDKGFDDVAHCGRRHIAALDPLFKRRPIQVACRLVAETFPDISPTRLRRAARAIPRREPAVKRFVRSGTSHAA